MPGTAEIQVVADDETGEPESATILGLFGDVPDHFRRVAAGRLRSVSHLGASIAQYVRLKLLLTI